MSRAVELKVAGHAYRVVTSADPDELTRLAEKVDATLAQVTTPGRQPSAQSLVLAAITLAHELEEERARVAALEARYEALLRDTLGEVEEILAEDAALAPARANGGQRAASARR